MEMTPYQHRLLEMIREIKDPDLLWLLADGAEARVNRYDESTPISKETAFNFQKEIQRLYDESEKERNHEL